MLAQDIGKKHYLRAFGGMGYDHVMANPPFYAEGAVRPAPDAGRAVAHVMPPGELENWIRFLATIVYPTRIET